MIDLRIQGLPDAIEVDGKPFNVKTNFRDWLKFGKIIEMPEFRQWLESGFVEDTGVSYHNFFYLFTGPMPSHNFIPYLMDFYANPNATPNNKDGDEGRNKAFDYILDGEYIVASFMQAYGIDLTEVEHMHWHLFKALFIGLPPDTKIKEIMEMRSWDERDERRDYKKQRRKLRDAWELPRLWKERDEEILKEINNEFYGAV